MSVEICGCGECCSMRARRKTSIELDGDFAEIIAMENCNKGDDLIHISLGFLIEQLVERGYYKR